MSSTPVDDGWLQQVLSITVGKISTDEVRFGHSKSTPGDPVSAGKLSNYTETGQRTHLAVKRE